MTRHCFSWGGGMRKHDAMSIRHWRLRSVETNAQPSFGVVNPKHEGGPTKVHASSVQTRPVEPMGERGMYTGTQKQGKRRIHTGRCTG